MLALDGAEPAVVKKRVKAYSVLRKKLEERARQQLKAKNARVQEVKKRSYGTGSPGETAKLGGWNDTFLSVVEAAENPEREQSIRAWQQFKHEAEHKVHIFILSYHAWFLLFVSLSFVTFADSNPFSFAFGKLIFSLSFSPFIFFLLPPLASWTRPLVLISGSPSRAHSFGTS